MKTKEPPYTERYVRWCGRKNNAVSHPPATGQGRKKVRTNKRISLHSDAEDAGKRNMRRNEVYHEIKSEEKM